MNHNHICPICRAFYTCADDTCSDDDLCYDCLEAVLKKTEADCQYYLESGTEDAATNNYWLLRLLVDGFKNIKSTPVEDRCPTCWWPKDCCMCSTEEKEEKP
jgi:hypothetical protein